MILRLRAQKRRYLPKKSTPEWGIRGAWGGTVSEDALLACGFLTE